MQKNKSVWGKYERLNETVFHFRGGYTDLYLKRENNSWYIKRKENEEVAQSISIVEEIGNDDFSDADIYYTGKSDSFYIRPVLPEKPVVFRNNTRLGISPKQTLLIYLAVPLSVQFYTRFSHNEALIWEQPLQRLSDTWFGEADSGEPAFSIGSRFGFKPEELKASYFEVICPVKIHNTTDHFLDIQRLIVHVEHMNLYEKQSQLFSDTTYIEFKGVDLVSNVHYAADRKLLGNSPVKLSSARKAVSKNIISKSFHFIKNLT